HYCSCLGARGGGGFRRLGRAHPRKGDFVGWMRALELVDRDDLAREILPAFANYWSAEHSDVFTLDRCTWRNLDPIRERKLRLRAFNVGIQNENPFVTVVRDVSRASTLPGSVAIRDTRGPVPICTAQAKPAGRASQA